MSIGSSHDAWRDGELELRREEVGAAVSAVQGQRRTAVLQVLAVIAGLVASGAAAFAAYQAGLAVRVAAHGSEQQSADNQLSTAISAIGGKSAAERVAGMTLLRLNVAARISSATSASERQNAFGEYVTALDVLANYIRSGSTSGSGVPTSAATPASFGPGYGYPFGGQGPPFDVIYAADELRVLLSMQGQVRALGTGHPTRIDLSRDELSGLSWTDVRFDWLASSYMLKIDLRGANLTDSRWGPSSYLVGAFLQCADLSGANLSGANLKYADLRGANVNGANFENANLHGAKLAGIFGKAKGLKPGLSADSWNPNPQSCLSNEQYWDKPPTP